MIKVKIEKGQSDRIKSFEMSGHAHFAEHGKDLVCAGASAVSFGALNAVIALTGNTPIIDQGTDGGYLRVVFSEDEIENDDIQLIIKAMIVSLQTIEQDYGQHIKIIFKK
ncbi:ribosomal-processing cysteine protease Prp [Sporosarcina pasteurii]|uniref:Ribosomal processing cysteine protease Prp n=1 Tax=Sporosarcina pasteurii TaxID=1474 RepID=A0A380BUW7_SPOPA|nr:ribosomal-processing cysteine protease Prp [Sporosarcina pasteurii]MDS9471319.1 ribosomal-processing cysteine protease Prp [Sporosarcina pasteurii]QBQ05052.1 ribosomal-processing cysteine protease Prp [Sporosarcina pasteurii]SUJ07585.1 Predicted ribosomal protein [Sporosarcina pasteurii]